MTDEKIKELVQKTLSQASNVILMLAKHGNSGVHRLDHGQLHLDFDDREPSGWNCDLLKLFPLRYPVAMTTWKGTVAVHFLDESHVFDVKGTREVFEYVLKKWGDETEMEKKLENFKYSI